MYFFSCSEFSPVPFKVDFSVGNPALRPFIKIHALESQYRDPLSIKLLGYANIYSQLVKLNRVARIMQSRSEIYSDELMYVALILSADTLSEVQHGND